MKRPIFWLLSMSCIMLPLVSYSDGCTSDPLERVCNGGFEEPLNSIWGPNFVGPAAGTSTTTSPGIHAIGCLDNQPGPNCYVPYWNSPNGAEGFGVDRATLYSKLFDGLHTGIPAGASLPNAFLFGHVDPPNGGNSVANVWTNHDSSVTQQGWITELQTQLRQPLAAGQTYQVNYDFLPHPYGTVDGVQGCLQFEDGVSSHVLRRCDSFEMPPATGPTAWQHACYLFTPAASLNRLRVTGNIHVPSDAGIHEGHFLFDNISVRQTTELCPNGTPTPTPTPSPTPVDSGGGTGGGNGGGTGSGNPPAPSASCEYPGAVARVYPNPVQSGGEIHVKLEQVNVREAVIHLYSASGAEIMEWQQPLSVLSPKFDFTLPGSLANGVYLLRFEFPKCFVGSDLTAKILIAN